MAIDNASIQHLANLASIETDSPSNEQLCQQIGNILTLVDQLKQVDTSNVSPLTHPLELTQRLRDDNITEACAHDAIFSNAPLKEDDVFLVPKVINVE